MNSAREPLRPLTTREREILEMLLSIDLPGVEALRQQIAYASAAKWKCGCASFDIAIDQKHAPRSSIQGAPVVEAQTRHHTDASNFFELLLWVEDGWLDAVEIVDYVDKHGKESPDEIPGPEAWSTPVRTKYAR